MDGQRQLESDETGDETEVGIGMLVAPGPRASIIRQRHEGWNGASPIFSAASDAGLVRRR